MHSAYAYSMQAVFKTSLYSTTWKENGTSVHEIIL